MTTGKTITLTRWTFVGKVMSLLFNMLSRLVITFLPRSKHLLISWLQSTICSDFGAPRNKVWHCFHCFLIYFPAEEPEIKLPTSAGSWKKQDLGIWSHHFMAKKIYRETVETMTDFIFLGSKITTDSDCKIWKSLAPWMQNYDQARQHTKKAEISLGWQKST